MNSRIGVSRRPLPFLLGVAMLWSLCVADNATAQRRLKPDVARTIDAGATITVRTNETINTNDSDGQVFTGIVERDVINRNGRVAIPRGADVEMVVKETTRNEVILDLDSIIVGNQRFLVEGAENRISESERRDGLGANKRTGTFVGGGALLGAIIGGIAGGGKGAAIGAGVGAAGGAGVQVMTRGKRVSVPAESLLTFRLQQPMQVVAADNGFYRSDARRDPDPDPIVGRNASIRVRADNQVTWEAPGVARIYVQVDNNPRKLFAEGQSGTQEAPWMIGGHRYVFIMVDSSGYEIGRDVMDLRR